jgi:voltage-gated potassium channel
VRGTRSPHRDDARADGPGDDVDSGLDAHRTGYRRGNSARAFSEASVQAAPARDEDIAVVLAGIERDRKGTVYELFILLLSILSIANTVVLALSWIAGKSGPASEVVLSVEASITPMFLADFAYRLLTADSRGAYVAPILRILGVVRVVRVIRSYRLEGAEQLIAEFRAARALATFLVTLFLVIVVTEVAGATIYYAESGHEGSNIASAGDAIWWALVTITTVGYGDRYPVTDQGRTIGVFLLFAGIALFSVLTGFIANLFLAPRKRLRLADRASSDLQLSLDAVRALVAEQEASTAALQARLDELERLLARQEHPPP